MSRNMQEISLTNQLKYWLIRRRYKYSPDIYQYTSLLIKDHDPYRSITNIWPIMARPIINTIYKTLYGVVRYAFINYQHTLFTLSTYLIIGVPFSGHPRPSINICGMRLKGRNQRITAMSAIVRPVLGTI